MCARAFVGRNGYLAPELARPESAVPETIERMVLAGKTPREAIAARARELKDDPSVVCRTEYGYLVLFPYASSKDPLNGRIVSMDHAYGSMRVEHSLVFNGLPPGCTWTAWVKQ
jgi:hypothetical protein